MSKKIVGVTVGTPISPDRMAKEILPTVTEKDEGKALKVQGGKWTAQEDETAEPLSGIEIEELLKNFS